MKDRAGWAIVAFFGIALGGMWIVDHYADKRDKAKEQIEERIEVDYGFWLKRGQKIGVLYGGTARSGLFVENIGGKFIMADEKGFIAIINQDKITAVIVVPPQSEVTE